MSEEDKQQAPARWGVRMAAVLAAVALVAELFRMNDPWLLLPLSLCVAVSVLRLHFRFSAVDIAVLAVCLYDVAAWMLNLVAGMYAARISLTGLCVYLLLREASCRTEGIPLFLKLATGITSVALAITLASFAIWTEAVHGAGFADIISVPFPVPPFRLHYKRMGKCMAACIGDAHGRDVPDNPMAEGVRCVLGTGFDNDAAVFFERSLCVVGGVCDSIVRIYGYMAVQVGTGGSVRIHCGNGMDAVSYRNRNYTGNEAYRIAATEYGKPFSCHRAGNDSDKGTSVDGNRKRKLYAGDGSGTERRLYPDLIPRMHRMWWYRCW